MFSLIKKFTPPPKIKFKNLVWLVVLLVAFCAISGGCGSSHSGVGGSSSVNDVLNGIWVVSAGDVSSFSPLPDGTTQNISLNILKSGFYFQDSDIDTDENGTGSTIVSALAILSSDETVGSSVLHIRNPFLLDAQKLTLTRVNEFEWTGTTSTGGAFSSGTVTITIDEDDSNKANFKAKLDMQNGQITSTYTLDLELTKDTSSKEIDASSVLAGTWTVPITALGENGGALSSQGTYSFIEQAYANATFSDVDLNNKKAHIVLAMAAPIVTYAVDGSSAISSVTSLIKNTDITIEHAFGNFYRLTFPADPDGMAFQNASGVLVLESDSKAFTVINASGTQYGQNLTAGLFFNVEKQTTKMFDESTSARENITLVSTSGFSGGSLVSEDIYNLSLDSNDPFKLTLQKVDVANGTITVSVGGKFNMTSITGTTGTQQMDIAAVFKQLDGQDNHVLPTEIAGTNMLYSKNTNSTFLLILIDQTNFILFSEIAPQNTSIRAAVVSLMNPQASN